MFGILGINLYGGKMGFCDLGGGNYYDISITEV